MNPVQKRTHDLSAHNVQESSSVEGFLNKIENAPAGLSRLNFDASLDSRSSQHESFAPTFGVFSCRDGKLSWNCNRTNTPSSPFKINATTEGRGEIVPLNESSKSARKQALDLKKLVALGILPDNTKVGRWSLLQKSAKSVIPLVNVCFTDDSRFELYTRARISTLDKSTSMRDKPIHIVIGSCLFSASHAYGLTNNNERVAILDRKTAITRSFDRLKVHENLSLYELEGIARLCNIANKIATERGGGYLIGADIPKVQYYSYLFEAYEKKLISLDILKTWIKEVDRRSELVIEEINSLLGERVFTGDALGAVEDYIKACIEAGKLPALQEAMDKLSNGDDLWAGLFEYASPKTWSELSILSYAYVQIDSADAVSGSEGLSLALEHRGEERIVDFTQKALRFLLKEHPEDYPNGLPFGALLMHEPILFHRDGQLQSDYLYKIEERLEEPDMDRLAVEEMYGGQRPLQPFSDEIMREIYASRRRHNRSLKSMYKSGLISYAEWHERAIRLSDLLQGNASGAPRPVESHSTQELEHESSVIHPQHKKYVVIDSVMQRNPNYNAEAYYDGAKK